MSTQTETAPEKQRQLDALFGGAQESPVVGYDRIIMLQAQAELERRNRERSRQESIPSDWEPWLKKFFGPYVNKPFGKSHRELWDWAWAIERGVRPRPFIAAWGREQGKCLVSTTPIQMADGTRKIIGEVEIGDEIASYDEDSGNMVTSHITNKWHSGTKPCITIKTRTREITLTREHKVLTFDGWKQAGDLVVGDLATGDRIASPRFLPMPEDEVRTDEEVRLLAYMLAEGGTSWKSGSSFTNMDEPIVDDVRACAESMGFELNKVGGKSTDRYCYTLALAADWVRETGMRGCKATEKRVPEWVLRLPVAQKWMFLAAFIDTDGFASYENADLGICLANPDLIDDLRTILLSVGVPCRNFYKDNGHAGAWTILVDQNYLEYCYGNLPLRLKGDRLRAAIDYRPRYSRTDMYPASASSNLPAGVNRSLRRQGIRVGKMAYGMTRGKLQHALELFEYAPWRKMEDADVFWDHIVSIEDAGEHDTCDIEVAEYHNMISGGLVTHNSSSAELVTVSLGARNKRKYVWYVRETQDQADKSVQNIAAMMQHGAFADTYPDMATPLLNNNGGTRAWRRQMLQAANGFTVEAIGLNKASRGGKIDWQRPDVIILDDIDGRHDTMKTTARKIETISQSLLPAGAQDVAVFGVQNLIIPHGIFSRLCNVSDEKADFLTDRIVSGPHPAVIGLEYEQDSTGYYRITAGTATWEGQPIDVCERNINLWGPTAFILESQHEVHKFTGGMFEHIEYVRCNADQVPELKEIHVWVDPAVTKSDTSDHCGIQADGLGVDGRLYRLWSWEKKATPLEAMKKAIEKVIDLKADTLGIETNQGGDTWKPTFQQAWDSLIEKPFAEIKMTANARVDVRGMVTDALKEELKAIGIDMGIANRFDVDEDMWVFGDFYLGSDGKSLLIYEGRPTISALTRKPILKFAKAGSSTGGKVHRNGQMLADYELNRITHVRGTHMVLEKALNRFPMFEPDDLADAAYWSWKHLLNRPRGAQFGMVRL